jgi:hypothetical protein
VQVKPGNPMRSRPLFILSLVFFFFRAAFSQDSSTVVSTPQHAFTLSTGISSHTVRDEMMSPLMYRGTQIPLAFTYRFRGLENRHTVLFSFDNAELKSSITKIINDAAVSHYINNLHLNLEYSFCTRAAVFENLRTTCFLGTRLSSILNLRNHYFQSGNNLESAEQMTGLGIYLLTETAIQRESDNYLRVEINIPCVSYVLLSERYNANVSETFDGIDVNQSIMWQLFKRGNLVSFNRLFEVQADVSYVFFVTNHIGFDLKYRVLYYSFTQYQDLFHARVLNNQYLLGVTVTL